jgi:hypothetical protein
LAEGVVVVAETLCDFLLLAAVEEDAAEGLVLALGGTGGLKEEVPAGIVRHGAAPEYVR